MNPIGHPSQPHYAAAERCIARVAHAWDIGGARSNELREIAARVVEAERRRAPKPHIRMLRAA